MGKKLIDYIELSKKLIEVGVKEEDFLPSSSYVAEIEGYPYGGKVPGRSFKEKLGFFDLDGSLNKNSTPDAASLIISNLIERCKIKKEEILKPIKHLLQYQDFNNTEKEITRILKRANFNYEKYVEISYDVANKFQPIKNCKEYINFMKEDGYRCILASLSFEKVVKLIGKKLGFDESYGSPLFFDENGDFIFFRWLRKWEVRDKKFKEKRIPHGCCFIFDDDPNSAAAFKTGMQLQPSFLVEKIENKPFDTSICVPEIREKDDMLLLKWLLKRWENLYIEVRLNSLEVELEKVKIAEEIKKCYKELLSEQSEISFQQFSSNVAKYLLRERRPERKALLLDLLTHFEKDYDLAIAKEIHNLLSLYPAYKMSEKFRKIFESNL
jgi:phosphoserine phosphatase